MARPRVNGPGLIVTARLGAVLAVLLVLGGCARTVRDSPSEIAFATTKQRASKRLQIQSPPTPSATATPQIVAASPPDGPSGPVQATPPSEPPGAGNGFGTAAASADPSSRAETAADVALPPSESAAMAFAVPGPSAAAGEAPASAVEPRSPPIAAPSDPAAKIAVAPKPGRPAGPPRLSRVVLMGATPPRLVELLGEPSLARREPPAELWQWRTPRCVLDAFLFDKGRGPTVTHLESRDRTGADLELDRCLETMKGPVPTS